ncbi:hypothetical protein L484_022364 [Morus notabilis]|uniref:Uncharacterized protein n=1 Tax=Morus notabilis TaxID=981085 RepID=W9QU62_9ROSA|nr:hypothetical protein L484_022364 [Morus notabilis]
MASNCVRNAGSHSRNLLRVKRGLDMVWVLFKQILIADWFLVDSYEQRELIALFHKQFAEGIALEYICLSGLFVELAMRFQLSFKVGAYILCLRCMPSYARNNRYQCSCGRGNSLKDPASKAYAHVFAPHHG